MVRSASTTLAVALVFAAAFDALAAKKYIFAGWDLGDVSPQEILENADKFDKSGCDGVAVALGSAFPSTDQDVRKSLHVTEPPRWSDEDVAPIKPILRGFGNHPGLRHSFFRISFAPRKERISWTDDVAWRIYADNAAAAAMLAKEVAFEGIVADFEDYWKKRQFLWKDGDPTWDDAKALARRRGREVFAGVFAAYPEITILTFQLLTTDIAYPRRAFPVAYMEEKRDLWPSFVNGILDAMPPTAKIVDGDESFSYRAEASKMDFYKSVRDQTIGVLPLVAPENRAKYRAQLSVGFGLYLDSYSLPTNSPHYFGPVRGKRINHFEDNLRQATLCADEYVWFWGEKGFFIDWPEDLKERRGDVWRSHVGMKWRRKYFEGSWGRLKPWRETIDGDVDLLLRGVKDPSRCVRGEYARQVAAGTFTNIFTGKLSPLEGATNGNVCTRISDLAVDGWYGVKVKGRGEILRGNAYFQHHRSWRWNLGAVQFDFAQDGSLSDGWREGVALVRIPDGATDIFVMFEAGKDDNVKTRRVEFRDLEVFKIK